MNHAHIDYAAFGHQIISDCTLSESFTFEFPIQDAILEIHLHFDSSQCAWLGWLADLSPRGRLLLFNSICVMYFTVCKMETKGLDANLIFRSSIVFWHYADLDTIHLGFRDCDSC